jgi:hypothetical protein
MNEDPASLDRLHGLAVPEAVSFWPPATGWWVLSALVLLALLVVVIRFIRIHRINAYRRAALFELQWIDSTLALATLLKRTALAAWPRDEVAELTGDRWIEWLGETGPRPVPEELRSFLRDMPYLDPGRTPPHELMKFAADWITFHRR